MKLIPTLIPTLILMITCCGLYLFNYRKLRVGMLFFAVSALMWCLWNIYIGEYQQAIQQGASGIITIATYFWWGRIDDSI